MAREARKMTRVLVTGSRDITDVDLVHDALSEVFERYDDPLTVVHGGARGADTMAGEWAALMRRYGVREEVHHADWHTHDDGCPKWHWELPRCKRAGVRRNQEMVDAGADIVLAFYRRTSENVGTKDCVRRAKLAKLPVMEYTQP